MTLIRALSPWPTLLVLLAPVLLYLAERLFPDGPVAQLLRIAAGAMLLGGAAGHVIARRRCPAAAPLLNGLLMADAAVLLAGLLYTASRLAWQRRDDEWAAISLVAGLVLLLLALASLLALALAARAARRSGFVEAPRVGEAASSGLILSLAVSALALVNFALQRSDWRVDLAHQAPSTPSPATLALVQSSELPLEILLFFEKQSPVLGQLQSYFDALQDHGVAVRRTDQELEFDLAKSLKVNRNGTITLIAGERHESWQIGEDYADARRRLRELDHVMRQRLSQLARSRRTIYFTHEHGERPDRDAGPEAPDAARTFGELVRSLNNKVLYLSPARLGREVPRDADLVVIHGPSQQFLPQEVESLRRYTAAGGALLLLLDPEHDTGLEPLLASLGLERGRDVLAHERDYFRDTQTPADRGFIFATSFTRHPAVRSLSDVRRRAAVMFRRAGLLQRTPDSPGQITMLIQSRARTFTDRNGNWEYDADSEREGIYDLAAAVALTGPDGAQGRSLVVADSDVFDDRLMTSEPNLQFALDALLWLLHDDASESELALPVEVPIRHTRDSDLLWFYGSTFAVPLLVMMLGLGVTRRARRRR